KYINRLFFSYRNFVRVYINNIVIFSKNINKYYRYVKTVLRILDENRISIALNKLFVAYLVIRLLSYEVNGDGITKTNDRIEAFKKIKFPYILAELETYFSIVGFLRNSIA
ncbi:hypothetical protein CONLIGDRAFT_573781, partial [Coniochaeta ligniaria NRRL 30616]